MQGKLLFAGGGGAVFVAREQENRPRCWEMLLFFCLSPCLRFCFWDSAVKIITSAKHMK